ncbi:hypothetical protein B0T11DRAFT_284987 [Plectosphaerella cucumerina]|uniref:Uncharacterized protein n=1 Tax=Plectosphaerella cucumerina TaxID=40658 RepID=A0A8K0THV5_9PEZI|nr:hypothetical protein B0T11DRAFT_284987 [Plectosphaerella cucumerina]
MPPGHPFVSQGGPRPPGPPFFTQPPFNPGSAPPRPPSSPRSESSRSSSSQSSTKESRLHSADDSPPEIPIQPPIPQRTAFYGEPKYSEYQLPGDRQPSPRPSFLSALPDDVQVSSWTDVTRVSWTKGRVGEVEDEHIEASPPPDGPPFPPGASGGPFNPLSAPAPPNLFQPQPGNMPPPGMQPFSSPFGRPPGEAFVPGTQP